MTTSTLKTAAVLTGFAVLATLSPAPHLHKGKAPDLPMTENRLEQAQSVAKSIPIQGTVDLTGKQAPVPDAPSDQEASNNVLKGQSAIARKDAKAVSILKSAEKDIENSRPSPFRTLIWFLLAGSFGYGAFFAFRKWADKTIPEPKIGY